MTPSLESNDIHALSYEQAFAELETIVDSLEADQKSLDASLALYERGQALAAHCAALLDQAELRVRRLDAPGALSLENGESR